MGLVSWLTVDALSTRILSVVEEGIAHSGGKLMEKLEKVKKSFPPKISASSRQNQRLFPRRLTLIVQ